MKRRFLAFFPLFALLTACEPTVANRGSMLDADVVGQIKPGETTREEVAARLGTPTSISTFNENVWYYIGRETEQYSFFAPEVMEQKAVEIDFDDKGIVVALNDLDLSKAADISPIDRETPTFGQKNTLLRELIGDLGNSRPNMGGPNRGGGT